ncbi:hypothetical protein GIB67_028267 [Kingdonia uniflora]|uniref:Pseudouridine synthase RsuA/RluA-like domain-containing protein n=1 Tax=Kingdonia uniflora TaxID=39325 RepID=A0A7J7KZA0_9MAGN|nr:hypothetical protein GIB67_028267 [Kingdonia uniflora]
MIRLRYCISQQIHWCILCFCQLDHSFISYQVVHPAPGNANGTLVNGILHHCSLPAAEILNSDEMHSGSEDSDDEMNGFSSSLSSGDDSSPRLFGNSVRPGIVHRLDKGTSGLLVVAKDEHSHAYLSEQFKQHTIHRVYISLTSGVPSSISGRIEVPIGRDVSNRIRMAALPGNNSGRQTRHAASR